MLDVDDLLGPVKKIAVDDLLGPPKKKRVKKVNGKAVRKYKSLHAPAEPDGDGIFALRESKGRNLGRTCLICKVELKHKRGRPPVICGKKSCFRAYRNAYRRDYDKQRAA